MGKKTNSKAKIIYAKRIQFLMGGGGAFLKFVFPCLDIWISTMIDEKLDELQVPCHHAYGQGRNSEPVPRIRIHTLTQQQLSHLVGYRVPLGRQAMVERGISGNIMEVRDVGPKLQQFIQNFHVLHSRLTVELLRVVTVFAPRNEGPGSNYCVEHGTNAEKSFPHFKSFLQLLFIQTGQNAIQMKKTMILK